MCGHCGITSGNLVRVVGCIVLAAQGAVFAADAGAKGDALKQAGLVRSGEVYVLPEETPVLDAMNSLRKVKREADSETRIRKAMDLQEAAKKQFIKNDDREWHSLESRLSLVTDVGVHNRIVLRMNRLVADVKEAVQAQRDIEDQVSKLSSSGKIKFVDDLAALNEKAGAVSDKYKSLADDPAIKTAIAGANSGAAKAALGPSAPFAAAVAELKKWQAAVESEAIPLRQDHGIHMVDVLLNGEHFLMGLDTGASAISLPAEVAEKLNLKPGEQDPTIQMQLADGSMIEGKQMLLKTVRVGRFTVDDVTCVVLQKGLPNAPVILGGSFLNHFIVKLDPAKDELHLTQIAEEAQPKVVHHLVREPAGAEGDKTDRP